MGIQVFKHCGRMLGYGRGEALDDATPPALDVAYGTVAVGETVEYDVIRIVEVVSSLNAGGTARYMG